MQAKVDYFSPLLWRVDVYGNVLYRFADAGTPLSWSVDHLFPVARGGLSKPANLRIVQSQAHLNKADRLVLLLLLFLLCFELLLQPCPMLCGIQLGCKSQSSTLCLLLCSNLNVRFTNIYSFQLLHLALSHCHS